MERPKRCFLLTAVGFVVLLWGVLNPAAVGAHAELVDAVPGVGSAEANPPASIELRFSELLDPALSSISLIASDGAPVALGTLQVGPDDRHIMRVPLVESGALDPGVYTVVWGAYSAEDGHASSGSYTFSFGTGQTPAQTAARPAANSVWSITGKWIELLGLVLLTGLAAFGGSLGSFATDRQRIVLRTISILAGVGLVGALIEFRVRVVAVSGGALISGLHGDTTSEVLKSTFGRAWIVRIVLLVVLLGLPLIDRKVPAAGMYVLAAGCGFLGLMSIAVSGHAGAVDPAWPAMMVDLVHMSAASIWLGGLLGLMLTVPVGGDDASARSLLRRQGNRFAVAVALIVVTGIGSAYWHIGGRRSLQATDYGRTLLLKIAIVAGLLGLAYYNRRVLQGERGQLRWVIMATGAELVLGGLVLLLSADLGQTPPANQPLVVHTAARAIDLSEQATAGTSAVQLSGVLTGDPTDEIIIAITPPEALQRVIIRSTLTGTGEEVAVGDRFDATPIGTKPGLFVIPAGRLGIAGPWKLEFTIRRAGVQDEIATMPVDTSGLSTVGTHLVPDRWGGFRLTTHTVLALGLAVAMMAIGLGGLRRITGLEPLASGFLLAASLVIAGGFLVSAARGMVPVTPDHALASPVDTSAGAITYAGDLYRLNCAICHGADGRGPGTSNLAHLHGNAADLTGSRTETQSDGDLRFWIANGVPGTRMPAFDPALTDDERWQLVVLIRQLQQKARDAEAAGE